MIHDEGLTAQVRGPGWATTVDGAALVGVFRGLLEELTVDAHPTEHRTERPAGEAAR